MIKLDWRRPQLFVFLTCLSVYLWFILIHIISDVGCIFDPYEYDMDTFMSHDHLGRHLMWQKRLILNIAHKVFHKMCPYLTCMEALLTSTILYHFHWTWPCLGVSRAAQSKPWWVLFLVFFFWDTFRLIWFWCNSRRISWWTPDISFEGDLMTKGK